MLTPLRHAADAQRYGAKAAALARMLAQGLRVPDGVVLPVACRTDRAGPQDTPQLRQALHAHFDPILRQTSCRLAVRSSAVGEDSAKHSWAGQLDTVLNVADTGALWQAIRTVWASAHSERSVRYQHRRGLTAPEMAVIVQRQIEPRHAGVLFTHAPAQTGLGAVMVIEYCAGLGDALVNGALDPARVLVARDGSDAPVHEHTDAGGAGLSEADIAQLAAVARRLEAMFGMPLDIEWAIDRGGLLWLLQARPITTAVQGAARADASTQAAASTQQAASCRPAVSIDAAAPVPARAVVWTNANIAENFPEPVSPLLYSIVRIGFAAYLRNLGLGFGIAARRAAGMEHLFENLIGVHFGRLYYNLSNIHQLLSLAPGGAWLIRAFNDFVGAGAAPTPALMHKPLGRAERALEALRIACKSAWQYLTVQKRIARFERCVERFCDATRPQDLARMSAGPLLDALRGFLEIRLRRWNDAALADTAAMVCYALLRQRLTTAWPEAGPAMHNNLLIGLPDLASHEPVEKLWALSRVVRASPPLLELFSTLDPAALRARVERDPSLAQFRARFETYLERWGFRGSGELMLTQPSPTENPEQTLALLKTYAALQGAAPDALLAQQAATRRAATEAAARHISPLRWLRALPGISKASRFRGLLRATQGAIRLRERARMQQARLYVRLRLIVLACGRRLTAAGMLDAPEQVFMLTVDELQSVLAGHAMFPYSLRDTVQQRQADHARLAERKAPDHFVLDEGAYLPYEPGGPQRSTEPAAPTEAVAPSAAGAAAAQSLSGVGACGGRIQAKAAVLADSTEIGRMSEGDIVVTRQTDPGWACVFFLARGLVVERGGMLSHGAIIAREFGIPAVVGVRDATAKIRSGALLAVDGDQGVVRILC